MSAGSLKSLSFVETEPTAGRLTRQRAHAPLFSPVVFVSALVIAEDVETQERLTRAIIALGETTLVAAVASAGEAGGALETAVFSVVMIDIDVAEGPALISRLCQHPQQMPVVVVASIDRAETVLSALEAGARGFVLKEREDIELTILLKCLQHGGMPIDPAVIHCLVEKLPKPTVTECASATDAVRLSCRELEVMQLLKRGCSNREIAELISVSRFTVEGHIRSSFRKLGVNSRTAAVFEAQKLGLLP